ncbi:hypothetical protein C3V36_14610 [Lachnospiraceae bacterium oral taxon 500]|nr:hypothetical protein C3V36_07280 [Lachnospiraceae bacterium oral taxon 500]AVM70370.1 hypothetical protein C3V36_14610 [Lachnospiraceae bacterium oral taxon 500]
MAGLAKFVNKKIEEKLGAIHTLFLGKVVAVNPLIILPLFGNKTQVEKPMLLGSAVYEVGDIVLLGVLQEYAEGGITRRFDLSDAVVLGKVFNL